MLSVSVFDDATLRIDEIGSVIELEFGDNYMSPSFTVQRWNAKYHGTREALDNYKTVEVDGNAIHVINDGYDYIYQVVTRWEGERFRAGTVHVFRTISGDEPLVY
jgi:hypothetical protein